jgi:hypothetical protein
MEMNDMKQMNIQRCEDKLGMIAKSLGSTSNYINVVVADKYVKKVIPQAVYMELLKDDEELLNLKDNNWVYEINGELYKLIFTSKYEDLVNFYNTKKETKQIDIFEFLC